MYAVIRPPAIPRRAEEEKRPGAETPGLVLPAVVRLISENLEHAEL